MKLFWSFIAMLVVGLGVAFAMPSDRGTDALPAAAPATTPAAPAAAGMSVEETVIEETDVADPAPKPELEATEPAMASVADAVRDAEELAEQGVSFGEMLESLSGEPLALPGEAATDAAAVRDEAIAVADEIAADLANDAEPAPAAENVGLKLQELADGSVRVNDRFTLVGDGTKTSPYQITWDYLTSARETYLPREGKKQIPEHITMLEGRYVKIGGYVQFPLAAPEPKELLVMLNQWDGCCIGVPPTPYDAIEVSLKTPATQAERFAVEGSLVGKLRIDPYLVGDWLIGLYLIGDATLDTSGARPAEEVYGNSPLYGHPDGHLGGQPGSSAD